MTKPLPPHQLKRKRGGQFDGPLVGQCLDAIKDCPRTVGELAALLNADRADVSKAVSKLVSRKRAVIMEDRDPETGKCVYEVPPQ